MNYIQLLLKIVKANPQLLIVTLEALLVALKADPNLAAEVIQALTAPKA